MSIFKNPFILLFYSGDSEIFCMFVPQKRKQTFLAFWIEVSLFPIMSAKSSSVTLCSLYHSSQDSVSSGINLNSVPVSKLIQCPKKGYFQIHCMLSILEDCLYAEGRMQTFPEWKGTYLSGRNSKLDVLNFVSIPLFWDKSRFGTCHWCIAFINMVEYKK